MRRIDNDFWSRFYDFFLKRKKISPISSEKREDLEKFFTFFSIQLFKGSFSKPHDVFFDQYQNMYVTQMGSGNKRGDGSICIFSKNLKLLKIINCSKNNDGLIDPVMCYVDKKKLLYISEYGNNKILIYKNDSCIDEIGKSTIQTNNSKKKTYIIRE